MGGYPYAYYGKRSADAEPKAEADPYLLYGGYHGLGYARYGLHYPSWVVMLTMERDLPMLKPRLIPMCMVDTMDSVDTVVMVDMDLDVVSTLDKQRISPH